VDEDLQKILLQPNLLQCSSQECNQNKKRLIPSIRHLLYKDMENFGFKEAFYIKQERKGFYLFG